MQAPDDHTHDDPAAPSADELFVLSRLTYASVGLALMAMALLSGGLGHGWLVRAVGGTLGMLAIVGMLTGAVATVRPSVLRGLRLGRAPQSR